jgi:hypothetical protein
MSITRRGAIGVLAGAVPGAAFAPPQRPTADRGEGVELNWLGGTPPAIASGVSWGVPWPRGAVSKDQTFQLKASVRPLPLQSWPLAFWPDGSIKWSGFATVVAANTAGPFTLTRGTPYDAPMRVRVTETPDLVQVDAGVLQARIARSGSAILDSFTVGGREVARQGQLVCQLSNGSSFTGEVRAVKVEQTGPVRAVVKIEGVHSGERSWLPFIVRLYFHAGVEAVRLLHTIVFDGDHQKDFIHSLGLTFAVPMREQVYNRHVRFSGEGDGLWAEPIEPLTGRRVLMFDRRDVYADQLAAKRVPDPGDFNAAGQKLIRDWAVWDSFKLVQPNAHGFTIQKRTNSRSCWLDAGGGGRSSGLVFAGDTSGGLAAAVRNFWQSYPAALEVNGASEKTAALRVWLWSPDAPAMDLRHYDTRAHDLDSSYEDVQPGFSTPHGVARTSEITLYPVASVPEKTELVKRAHAAQAPAQLVCSPRHYHSTRAFGIWSLPDRSTAFKRAAEEQLDAALAQYLKEPEQRHWYGFWNYGDVMHTYDRGRHAWRYDIGGFAWDNSELATDMWLWYSFLRTGRADLFRMAEAMTRHTGEVDVYHLGRFAGLGSRHNVRHWGCGAKEARISQAAYRRFYYYLTCDERTGDLMHEVANAEHKFTEIDPMRLAAPTSQIPSQYPARIRGGPDWLALVSNWMTEWERTGDTKYRDKIVAGLDSIAGFKYGFLSGPQNLFGFDPDSGKLYTLTADPHGTYNLTTNMGGPEVLFELMDMIDHPGWNQAWLEYCRLFSAPKDVIVRDRQTGAEGADGQFAGAGRLAAYAYWRTKNPAFARRAVRQVLVRPGSYATRRVDPPEVLYAIDEAPDMSTNGVAQSSLNTIQILELCGDQLPETL